MKEPSIQQGVTGDRTNRSLHWFAILLSCMTVGLLVAGALVTSNEAGDSVPDWPLSFGRWLIRSNNFIANVRYEYSHRFVAGVVGATTLIFAMWAYFSERRAWMRRLGLIALAGVIAQAGIGGLRVLLPEYKAAIAVPHALVAQSFFGLIVAMAVFTSRSWSGVRESRPDVGNPGLRKLATMAVAAVLIQLVLGAGFRHGAFGIIPHISGALVVTALIISTSVITIRRHGGDGFLTRPAKLATGLVIVQAVLGVAAYLARLAAAGDPQPLEPMISLTVAHLVVGALTLASVLVLCLRSHRALSVQSLKTTDDVTHVEFRSPRRAAV
ncbi:MAG TPA: COX15/CtaA family protein [Blastocatellia bacterium]|nr:COX15/CtaA family protein [Blastocatellia bacterium]